MPRRPSIPSRALLALGLAAALGASACGTDERDDYAEGWNGVCRDVAGAMSTFRSDVSSAATTSADAGDEAIMSGLRRADVAADVATPARKLARALRPAVARAGDLQPPAEWASWHAGAARELAARERGVGAGVRRLQAGDPEALPLVAIGSVGPAAVRAPQGLRERAPDCTVLR